MRSTTRWPALVDKMLALGRELDAAASRGEAADHRRANDVVRALSTYTASLPPAEQPAAAQALVQQLMAS